MELVNTNKSKDKLSVVENSINELETLSSEKVSELKGIKINDEDSCDLALSESSNARKLFNQIQENRKKLTKPLDNLKKKAMVPEKKLEEAISQTKNNVLIFQSKNIKEKEEEFEDAVVINEVEVCSLDIYRNFSERVINLYVDFIKNYPALLKQIITSDKLSSAAIVDELIAEKVSELKDEYDRVFDQSIDKVKEEIGVKGIGSFMKYFNEGNFDFTSSHKTIKDYFYEVIDVILGGKDSLIDKVNEVKSKDILDIFVDKVVGNSSEFIQFEIQPVLVESLEQQLNTEYNVKRFESEFNVANKGNDLDKAKVSEVKKGIVSTKEGMLNVIDKYLEATDDIKGLINYLKPAIDYLISNDIEVDGMIVEKN